MYIISTSDGTSIEIESGVYAITNGETNIITGIGVCRRLKMMPDYLKKYKKFPSTY